jgi:hypothetical protein
LRHVRDFVGLDLPVAATNALRATLGADLKWFVGSDEVRVTINSRTPKVASLDGL